MGDKTDKESVERTSKDASRDRESQQRKSVDGGSKSVPASTTHQPVPNANNYGGASSGNKGEKPSSFRKDRPSPNNSSYSNKYNGDKSTTKPHHKFDKGYDKGRGNNNGYNNYQRGGGGYGGGYGNNRYESNRPFDSRGHRGGGNWGRGGGHYQDRGHNDRYYKNDRYSRSHGGQDSWRHRDSHYDDSRGRGSSERSGGGYHDGSEQSKEGYDDVSFDGVIVRDASDV